MGRQKFPALFTITLLFFSLILQCPAFASQTEGEQLKLYAKAAVLMDGDSGRVLYEKNGSEELPMASTTKIMTCILALESGHQKDVVTVSKKASAMPKVRLGMVENEQFLLEDLLYSLMLESHNDSAAAIAEQIGGSVEAFADMMNQKARDIGCYHTFFVTPNGLDASITDSKGTIHAHHTTAEDLARIMRYCIMDSPKSEEFLRITRTDHYSFSNQKGTRSFSCRNHNSFLTMMEGALSGKTGFTAKAGYCYVGALQRDERIFIVALLACGWPNHKTYKWSDTRLLMNYGLDHYNYKNVFEKIALQPVPVEKGVPEEDGTAPVVPLKADYGGEEGEIALLLRENEQVQIETDIPDALNAPVKKNTAVGKVRYLLDGKVMREFPIVTASEKEELDMRWSLEQILKQFCA